jgi:hypothetical protein
LRVGRQRRRPAKSKGLPYEEVKKQFQAGVEAHNHEETPNFASSIQRMAVKK